MTETYVALRAMKGRGRRIMPLDLETGQVVRVDGVKYRVQAEPLLNENGSVVVHVYNEDNQYDTLFLSPSP